MSPGEAKPSWIERNWKWAVPLGCLGLLAAFVAFLGSIFFAVSMAVRSSDAYQAAVDRAREHPQVTAALGEPLDVGWLITGSINVNGPSGDADLSIPLEGPRGAGTLYVVAEKVADQWSFERLEVAIEGSGERISLLPE